MNKLTATLIMASILSILATACAPDTPPATTCAYDGDVVRLKLKVAAMENMLTNNMGAIQKLKVKVGGWDDDGIVTEAILKDCRTVASPPRVCQYLDPEKLPAGSTSKK